MKAKIEHLIIIIITLFYMLFIDGNTGFIFLCVLIFSPIISVSLTQIVKRQITITSVCLNKSLSKKSEAVYNIVFNKRGIIPTPFITVVMKNSQNFKKNQYSTYKITLGNKGEKVLSIKYIANYFGLGEIKISNIFITDFLGLFKFHIYNEMGQNEYLKLFEIYPDIPEISSQNQLIQTLYDNASYDDNEDEAETKLTFSGYPGYEHREYVPGDSLKKINYKLSMKRENLLVRLDEGVATSKINITLDYSSDIMGLAYGQIGERLVESLIGIAYCVIQLGLRANVYIFLDKQWNVYEVTNEDDIFNLQYSFCRFRYSEGKRLVPKIPLDLIQEHGGSRSVLVFTANNDRNYVLEKDYCNASGISVTTIIAYKSNPIFQDTWYVDNNYEFIKLM